MCTLGICLKIKCHIFKRTLEDWLCSRVLLASLFPAIKFGDVESEPNQIGSVELTFPGFGSSTLLFWDCRQVSKPVLPRCTCLYNDVIILASGDMKKLKITWMEMLEVSNWLIVLNLSAQDQLDVPWGLGWGKVLQQGIHREMVYSLPRWVWKENEDTSIPLSPWSVHLQWPRTSYWALSSKGLPLPKSVTLEVGPLTHRPHWIFRI